MIGIINGEFYCPKMKDVKGPAITFKRISGTDVFYEIYKEIGEKCFFSEPTLPTRDYML